MHLPTVRLECNGFYRYYFGKQRYHALMFTEVIEIKHRVNWIPHTSFRDSCGYADIIR